MLSSVICGGNVVSEVVSNRRRDTLLPIIKETVRPYSLVHTDEHSAYQTLTAEGYYHETVNHSHEQYVSAIGSSTNSIEGFWAAVKRGSAYMHNPSGFWGGERVADVLVYLPN